MKCKSTCEQRECKSSVNTRSTCVMFSGTHYSLVLIPTYCAGAKFYSLLWGVSLYRPVPKNVQEASRHPNSNSEKSKKQQFSLYLCNYSEIQIQNPDPFPSQAVQIRDSQPVYVQHCWVPGITFWCPKVMNGNYIRKFRKTRFGLARIGLWPDQLIIHVMKKKFFKWMVLFRYNGVTQWDFLGRFCATFVVSSFANASAVFPQTFDMLGVMFCSGIIPCTKIKFHFSSVSRLFTLRQIEAKL